MNTTLDWRLLKRLYSIHSQSGKEERMVNFLISHLKQLSGVKLGKDSFGNLYAVKGMSETYPCVVCHIDQVQRIHSKDFKAIETRDIIFGFSPSTHQFEGLGADDKNGILIALEALKKYDALKAVFFKEEETGCNGSARAEISFFDDCRFVIECDRRGNSDFITSIGSTDLCSEQFIQDIDPEKWGYKEENGLMTDVEALKKRGLSVSAVNISCGYYNPHTDEEITVKRDLEKCWKFVQHIIEDCNEVYHHEIGENTSFGYEDWETEEELHTVLQYDSSMTAADLFDMYHTNYPNLTQEDFQRIVEDFHLWYGYEEEETTTQTFNPNGKENDKEEYDF